MTYTYKLSRRLALSHIAVAAMALTAACGGGATGSLEPGVPAGSVSDVIVAPKQSTVPISHPTRFAAWGTTPEGDSLALDDLAWSATGGTINQDGVFQATASGTYRLVAFSRKRNKADTSVVVVTPAPTLAAVVVTPGSLTLAPGATQAFAASGRLSDGTSAPVTVTWSATGGTIDAAGVFTAGAAAGSYRVIAAAGALADTAGVTVATSAAGGHEPTDFVEVTERGFDATAEQGWSHANQNPNFSIVSGGYAGSAPRSGGNVGRIVFPAGFEDGMAPAKTTNEIFAAKKRLYVSMWVQVSPNWYGHSVNSKIGYVWTGDKPKVYFNLVGSGSGDLRFKVKTQDMNVAPSSGLANNNLADPVLARGQWHRIEMLLTANTFDQADGCLRAWVNGQAVLDQCGFNFNGTRAAVTSEGRNAWHKLEWNPIWGGTSTTTPRVPATQYMYMDHLYASGR